MYAAEMWDCRKWHGKHAGFQRGGLSISNPVRLKATRLGGARSNLVLTYLVLLVHCSVSTRLGKHAHKLSVYSKHQERIGIGNLCDILADISDCQRTLTVESREEGQVRGRRGRRFEVRRW